MSRSGTNTKELLLKAAEKIETLKRQLEQAQTTSESIAIIGMACRFPGGANSPEDYWKLLAAGQDVIKEIDSDRWPKEAITVPVAKRFPGTRWAGMIDDVDGFDAEFFGIAPVEAVTLDPQQRLLLEVSWEAIESAGLPASQLVRSKTGVFLGMASLDYRQRVIEQNPDDYDIYATTGNHLCTASGRLSYVFGLEGPCITIETACSSSLVAVHYACQSLRLHESDLALAAGVNLVLSPLSMSLLAHTEALSADGRCKSFEARANGFVRSDGCGVVMLKRLSEAKRDGDNVLAIIAGSAVNQDGRSTGLTAPNVLSQQALLRQALSNAKVLPQEIGYVETHGTGTPLGDPIEAEALRVVLGAGRERDQACLLGSVKGNIGHLEAAAGIAGLIKTVLVLDKEAVPPQAHFKTLNPRIDFAGAPFVIPKTLSEWKRGHGRRIAGVSSFGISGTNAHVIVEESPSPQPGEGDSCEKNVLLPISAKTPKALCDLARRYSHALKEGALRKTELSSISYTACMRRSHFEFRYAITGGTHSELADSLSRVTEEDVVRARTGHKELVFVFSGQGFAWAGMGKGLFVDEVGFREKIIECDHVFRRLVGWSLVEVLESDVQNWDLDRADIAQPLSFSVQVGIAALLQSWGVKPSIVVGHSIGEVAAAHTAGVLSLEDACKIVLHRSRLMQAATGLGAMAAISLSRREAEPILDRYDLSLAVVNSPNSVVGSGDIDAIERMLGELAERGVAARKLRVNCAFHSKQMSPYQEKLASALADIVPRQEHTPLFSTVTGKQISGTVMDAHYWARNIREPVAFAAAIQEIIRSERHDFVEISAHPVLAVPIEECLKHSGNEGAVMQTLRRTHHEREAILRAAGELHCRGYVVDLGAIAPTAKGVAPLPHYAWQRERFWLSHQNVTKAQPVSSADRQMERDSGLPSVRAPGEPAKLRETLIDTVAKLLKLPRVRVHSDRPLFEQGMDSLLALQVISRLQTAIGLQLTVADLLREETIDRLAKWLEDAAQKASGTGYASGPTISALFDTPPDLGFLYDLDDPTARSLATTVIGDISDINERQAVVEYLRKEASRVRIYPASYGQAAMYFVHRLAPNAVGYNVMFAAKVGGEVRETALESALRSLVSKHSALRTTFVDAGNRIFQRVLANGGCDFRTIDASGFDDLQLQAEIENFCHQPFDLGCGPIFRAALFIRDTTENYLAVSMHHIACDAGSMDALLSDLRYFYECAFHNRPSSLAGAQPFFNFVKWETEWLGSEAAAEARAYWAAQLVPPPPRIDLGQLARAAAPVPQDRAPRRSDGFAFEGEECLIKLDRSLTARLKGLANREGVTLYHVLLSGYFALVHRLTGIEDIAVGAYTNMRHKAEFEAQIGYYVNTVVLRSEVTSDIAFGDLLKRVKAAVVGAMSHQNYPLALLAEELKPPRILGRQIWFDHVFNWTTGAAYKTSNAFFMDAGKNIREKELLSLQPWKFRRRITQFDLALNMGENDGEIFGVIVCNSEIYDAETIRTLIARFRIMLSQIVDDPGRAIGALSMLDDQETDIIVREWNSTDSVFDRQRTLHGAFLEQVKRTPEACALRYRRSEMSYAELDARSEALAKLLTKHGLGPGATVGICVERSPLLIVGLFAILRTGAAYVPLDPSYPIDRIQYMLDDSGAFLVLTTPTASHSCVKSEVTAVVIDDNYAMTVVESEQPRKTPYSVEAGTAYLMYTSGSTGRPKGVKVSHASCAALFHWADSTFTSYDTTAVLCSTSVCFDISVFEIFYPLTKGGSIVLVQDALHFPDDPDAQRVSLINTVPSVMSALMQVAEIPNNVRTVTLVGEPLRRSLVDAIYGSSRVQKVYNLYGPTEDTVFSTAVLVGKDEQGEPSIGRPILNTRAYILDSNLSPVPPYSRGELCLAGAGLALGYHNRAELNRERFPVWRGHPDGPERVYRTGDLASYRSDGMIEFFGRTDYQVKIRGYRIELEEVEATINHVEGVREAAVVALSLSQESMEKELVAYVVTDRVVVGDGVAVLDADEQHRLSAALQKVLPEYMAPSTIVFVHRLAKTLNGKIDRKALPQPPARQKSSSAKNGEKTGTQALVAEIWGEALGMDPARLGVYDKFYELGGSSLRIVQVVAGIKRKLGRTVSIAQIFRFQDIASIAKWLDEGDADSQAAIDGGSKRGTTRRTALRDARRKQERMADRRG